MNLLKKRYDVVEAKKGWVVELGIIKSLLFLFSKRTCSFEEAGCYTMEKIDDDIDRLEKELTEMDDDIEKSEEGWKKLEGNWKKWMESKYPKVR